MSVHDTIRMFCNLELKAHTLCPVVDDAVQAETLLARFPNGPVQYGEYDMFCTDWKIPHDPERLAELFTNPGRSGTIYVPMVDLYAFEVKMPDVEDIIVGFRPRDCVPTLAVVNPADGFPLVVLGVTGPVGTISVPIHKSDNIAQRVQQDCWPNKPHFVVVNSEVIWQSGRAIQNVMAEVIAAMPESQVVLKVSINDGSLPPEGVTAEGTYRIFDHLTFQQLVTLMAHRK